MEKRDPRAQAHMEAFNACRGIAETDAFFARIAGEPDAAALLDGVEKILASDMKDFAEGAEPAQVAHIKKIVEAASTMDKATVEAYLSKVAGPDCTAEAARIMQGTWHVMQGKGDAAHPWIKRAAAAFADLPDDEYGTAFGLMKATAVIAEQGMKPQAANPFRKKPGGPQLG